MEVQEINTVPGALRELPKWAQLAWQRMIEMVREFRPDVIVLTARKMPRVCEGLRTDFGKHPLVISDFAVPFSSDYLMNARVAIVDDIVNVGSTLEQVAKAVEQYSPAMVKLFSLARRNSNVPQGNREITCAYSIPLTEKDYLSYVRTVPAVISHVCKPYDLVFPIFQAQYRIPFRSSAQIITVLKKEFGGEAVQIIATPYLNSPVRRISLLLPTGHDLQHQKIRLFFDDETGDCAIVPMVVSHWIEEADMPVKLPWVRSLRRNLKSILDNKLINAKEGQAAVAVFTSSLDWFWSGGVAERLSLFLQFKTDSFCMVDAIALFGPKIANVLEKTGEEIQNEVVAAPELDEVQSSSVPIQSPFHDNIGVDDLIRSAIKRVTQNGLVSSDSWADCYSYLLAFMDSLSELVGTEKPSEYKAKWPYSKKEIDDNPYLRLRIGPTFPDIVTICGRMYQLLTGSEAMPAGLSKSLSITLDALIDQGAIVPTFANYEGKIFRIYRRGEGPGQDVCDKVVFAVAAHEQPISVTRLAKVLSALSHSEKYHDLLRSSMRTRGLVGGAHKTAFGAEPENIAIHLRNTGQIESVG